MVLGGTVSINIIPGYDFTFNELVTTEKLRKWIGNAHNSGTLTAADVGVSGDNTGEDLFTTATWATTASPGALTFNTTTGWVTVGTKWGHVPIFGGQGGLFSMRLKEGESNSAGFDRFYEGDLPNTIGVKAGHTPTLPASNYSAGEGYDLFGANSINVGACFMSSSDISLHSGGKSVARYPSANSYNDAGAWTVATYVTGTSFVHSMYKLGGMQTLRFKFSVGTQALTGTTHVTIIARELYNEKNIDYDTDNNLLFVAGGGGGGVQSWFFNGYTAYSLVDQDTTNGQGNKARDIRFDPDKRFLYVAIDSFDFEGLSIFEVDTSGNLTFLVNRGDRRLMKAVDYYGNVLVIFNPGSLNSYLINGGTNASFVGSFDPGDHPNQGCIVRNGSLIYTRNNDSSYKSYVCTLNTEGTITKIGGYADVGTHAGIDRIKRDNSDESLLWEVGNAGTILIKVNENGTAYTLSKYDGNLLGPPVDSFYLAGESTFRIYNKSIVTNATVVYSFDTDPVNLDGIFVAGFNKTKTGIMGWDTDFGSGRLTFFTEYVQEAGSSGVSGLRGKTNQGVWQLNTSTVISSTTEPGRIIPLSQCFNYCGEKQLSGGYVIPILDKNEFRIGGNEF